MMSLKGKCDRIMVTSRCVRQIINSVLYYMYLQSIYKTLDIV